MKRVAWLLALCMLMAIHSHGAGNPRARKKGRRPRPAMKAIEDDPTLPRVLLIGDSISIGYTLPVRKLLKGKANVHRPLTNCGPTIWGLASLDKWLGNKPWDVIHFNWGLHDLKYMGPNGENLADPNAKDSAQQVSEADYEKNLDVLVTRLAKTGATLIWCSTTPVPHGAKGRVEGDAVKYNAIAARVMAKHNVEINDLYTFAKARQSEIQRKADVHFHPDGSGKLAETVAQAIQAALDKRKRQR